jgi:conjugative transfer signal peptidase TraF
MPDARDLPRTRWGDALRRQRARRRTHIRVAGGGAAAVAALVATLLWPPRPLIVWNATSSSPVGLYRVDADWEARAGAMVLAWPPHAARRLAGERWYLPVNVPLLKRAAAVQGDRVCAIGEALFVNGRFLALRRRNDAAERPLPWWSGCKDLGAGDLLLLNAGAADSFDGRYFGVTRRADVIGRARLVWAR